MARGQTLAEHDIPACLRAEEVEHDIRHHVRFPFARPVTGALGHIEFGIEFRDQPFVVGHRHDVIHLARNDEHGFVDQRNIIG